MDSLDCVFYHRTQQFNSNFSDLQLYAILQGGITFVNIILNITFVKNIFQMKTKNHRGSELRNLVTTFKKIHSYSGNKGRPLQFRFPKDGAPPHPAATEVCLFLNTELPHSWMGRSGPDVLMLHSWPPRSPDMTPCNFFIWGFVKDKVYVPPLPTNLCELKEHISAAVQSITSDTLQHVWLEFTYCLDIIHVTKGSYIEHL
ncbi:hypothetical protein AVEN_244247-1 [Araneus ventricosus]|uniref:Uncharacterized protein n=1 Tax=Araneus ventricosus TaxID=182803 RepID=A0A4Y2TRE2_ARAVE|nr:hypothetical protein AVEN_244247-1 [Araneus ventricosus]